jgi:hypothetical protein
MRFSLPSVVGIVAIASAGAFAAGRSATPAPVVVTSEPAAPQAMPTSMPKAEGDEPLPPGHPPMGGAAGGGAAAAGEKMPPGHPAVDSNDMGGMGGMGGMPGAPGAPGAAAPATPSSLEWKIPARWQSAPNTSSMRIATYRIPRAAGDTEDGDLSITQAGGSVDANAQRWITQFDEPSQKSAKKSTRKVGPFEITVVEAKGSYTGMAADAKATSDRAMLGAIVPTPGMPHFFKLTGPAKTVLAARAEFDALVASFTVPKTP